MVRRGKGWTPAGGDVRCGCVGPVSEGLCGDLRDRERGRPWRRAGLQAGAALGLGRIWGGRRGGVDRGFIFLNFQGLNYKTYGDVRRPPVPIL